MRAGLGVGIHLLIVAEGIGSATRNQVFGNEVGHRPLDLYAAYFPPRARRTAFAAWHALGHAVLRVATALGFNTLYGKILSPRAYAIELPSYEDQQLA